MQGMRVAAEPLSAPPYATECAMTLTAATWPYAPPAPWPSTTPARTSTSLTLDMDTLIKALKPESTPSVQASGPPPNLAHLS